METLGKPGDQETLGKHLLPPTVSLPNPRPLQQLEVPLISRETCNCLYNINAKPGEPHLINQDMLCAGYVNGSKDACQVNAGGPGEWRRQVCLGR